MIEGLIDREKACFRSGPFGIITPRISSDKQVIPIVEMDGATTAANGARADESINDLHNHLMNVIIGMARNKKEGRTASTSREGWN